MAKRVTMLQTSADDPEGAPAPDAPPAPAPADSLEQRVQRLEDAVAALQDTRPLEDRVVERLSSRLGIELPAREPAPREPARAPAPAFEHMISAERRTSGPPPDGRASPAAPPLSLPLPPAPAPPVVASQPWLFFDLLGELRAMVQMFFDVRYRVAWSTRLTVLILLALLFTSGLWCPLAWVPVINVVVIKVIDLLLAFCIYKALSREARRYRDLRTAHDDRP
jgi:hypothetical protein